MSKAGGSPAFEVRLHLHRMHQEIAWLRFDGGSEADFVGDEKSVLSGFKELRHGLELIGPVVRARSSQCTYVRPERFDELQLRDELGERLSARESSVLEELGHIHRRTMRIEIGLRLPARPSWAEINGVPVLALGLDWFNPDVSSRSGRLLRRTSSPGLKAGSMSYLRDRANRLLPVDVLVNSDVSRFFGNGAQLLVHRFHQRPWLPCWCVEFA
jgi:hypothetical protein